MVINTQTDQVVDSVVVGHEPESMVTDKNGKIWVLCSGSYSGEYYPELICLDPETFSAVKTFTFPSKSEYPTTLRINASGDTLYFIDYGIYRMPIVASALPAGPYVNASGRNFYKIGIRDKAGEIFATNAVDYQQRGYLLRITGDGAVIDSARTDIIPGNMYFRKN